MSSPIGGNFFFAAVKSLHANIAIILNFAFKCEKLDSLIQKKKNYILMIREVDS